MSLTRRIARASVDPLIAAVLCAGYVALLLATVKDLGYARDEGFYFRAASQYRIWFDTLLDDPQKALEQSTIDRYWKVNHEHPAFVKSLFALSHKFFFREHEVFAEAGTAYRFPGMLLSGIAVATVYLWGRRAYGRLPGLIAALLLSMMPRIFYHSHLDCFDMPVLAMWLVTTYAYARSLEPGGLSWAIATGFLYGLLLNTKHNAWLLPPALVVHFLVTRGLAGLARDARVGYTKAPLGLIMMALIGPPVFYALWPWIWHDTAKRISDYVGFHTSHDYYNMEFLGVTYFKPPMPLGYAWVMTLATVPAITLLLFGLGAFRSLKDVYWPRVHRLWGRIRRRAAAAHVFLPEEHRRFSTHTLWLLCLTMSYAPWFSSKTPIFGGTKHWITAYPFLCLFAGWGFRWVLERLKTLVPERARKVPVAQVSLAACVLAAPITMTLHSHPWGLSAYTPLFGGAPGAASLGLNRSFWGYTTGAVVDFLNEHAPKGANVYMHDTAMDSWNRYIKDGRLRKDLHGSLSLSSTDVALYHDEQHMARVDYQIWVDYGTLSPAHVGAYDGVPVIWVYLRPKERE